MRRVSDDYHPTGEAPGVVVETQRKIWPFLEMRKADGLGS